MFYTIQNDIILTAEKQAALTAYYTNVLPLPEDYEVGKYIVEDNKLVINPNYDKEKVEKREEQFNNDFFKTSLGYIRRKVSMATGETKDFLSDLLPTISIGVQMGSPIHIITYDKPDFTQEITDWTSLQSVKTVTAEFIQECFVQLNNDFKPVNSEEK